MSTTLLFVELLIIGTQTSIWLFLISINVFGSNWLNTEIFAGLSEWETLISVVILSIIYVLGIIVDRVADFLFSYWDNNIRQSMMPSSQFPLSSAVMRFRLGKDNEYLNRQFEYTRSRIRISRASTLNFAITTLMGIWLVSGISVTDYPDKSRYITVIAISGIAITLTCFYAWNKLVRTYQGFIKANWDFYLNSQNPEKRSEITK